LKNPNFILLINDVSKSKYGILSLKAFRLTKEFIKIFIKNDYHIESINEFELNYDLIFEEIPVKIHNNHLISLYLLNLGQDNFNKSINNYNLSSNIIKSKITSNNVENLIESVDELNTFYHHLLRKKTPSNEVNLQDWLSISSRIQYNCEDVEQQILSQFLTDSSIRP